MTGTVLALRAEKASTYLLVKILHYNLADIGADFPTQRWEVNALATIPLSPLSLEWGKKH